MLNMTNESLMTSTSVCNEIHALRFLVENAQCLTAEIKPGTAIKSYLKRVPLSKHSARWVPKYGVENIQRKVRNRTAESGEYILMIGWRLLLSIKMFYYRSLRCIGAFMQIMEVIFTNGTRWNILFHKTWIVLPL